MQAHMLKAMREAKLHTSWVTLEIGALSRSERPRDRGILCGLRSLVLIFLR
jgi:hypothetical protein